MWHAGSFLLRSHRTKCNPVICAPLVYDVPSNVNCLSALPHLHVFVLKTTAFIRFRLLLGSALQPLRIRPCSSFRFSDCESYRYVVGLIGLAFGPSPGCRHRTQTQKKRTFMPSWSYWSQYTQSLYVSLRSSLILPQQLRLGLLEERFLAGCLTRVDTVRVAVSELPKEWGNNVGGCGCGGSGGTGVFADWLTDRLVGSAGN
jgi:hypothetical protein